jgi:hypothetical protein
VSGEYDPKTEAKFDLKVGATLKTIIKDILAIKAPVVKLLGC